MAEYYPLLAKAVSGLSNSTPEARRSIYERARKALINQLRSIQPPIAEADIDRESDSLDAAIARLEAELSVQAGLADALQELVSAQPAKSSAPPPSKPVQPASVKPSAPPPPPPPKPSVSPQPKAIQPEPPKPVEPPPAPPRRFAPPPPPTPAKPFVPPPPPKPAAPPPPAAPKPAPPPPPPPPPPPKQAPKPAPEPEPAPEPAREEPVAPKRGGLSAFAAPKTPLTQPAADDVYSPYDDELGAETPAELRPRAQTQRPAAPQPVESEGKQKRVWIVAGVVSLVVLVVAAAAWKLRDRPEDLARLKPPPQQAETGSSKIVERVGGGAREPEQTAPSRPPAQPAAPPDNAAVVPIAHRSALLVEAPEEASKVKTYIGRVVWRIENAVAGPGQALTSAVRAEVDVADAGFQAEMTIQKNTDPTLPASHTIKVRLIPAPASTIGNVKDIRIIEMRREDQANGDPLAGLTVKIAENSFLIGLMRGAAEASNIDLLRSRGWFDVPLMLANGKRAKITFEKGVSGDRILNDALMQWGAQ